MTCALEYIGEKKTLSFVFPTNITGAPFHLTLNFPFLQLSIFGPVFAGVLFLLCQTVPQPFIFMLYRSETS
jgi:hypothetical protein